MRRNFFSKSKSLQRMLTLCVAAGFLASCASSDVASEAKYEGDVVKPVRVIVYDFSASPQDVPPDSVLAGIYAKRDTPQTEEEVALGRKIGGVASEKLVSLLNDRGIPAERAVDGVTPQIGDGVIKGAFVSVDEGSQWQRMLIGFGAGANELVTIVEGYKMRDGGLMPLGSAKIKAEGGYMPGVLAPVGVGAATGNLARSVVISGAATAVKEFGPETIEAAAQRTAESVFETIVKAYKERGWIEE